jgi:hypothetical protein
MKDRGLTLEKRTVALTYDADENEDGTGAQIQRILGIYAVCQKFGLDYLHTPVKNLLVFPLDSFDHPDAVQTYLCRLNDYFSLPSDSTNQFDKVLKRTVVTPRYLRKLKFLKFFWRSRRVLVQVSNVSFIIDKDPNVLVSAVSDLRQIVDRHGRDKLLIALHIRGTVQEELVITGEVEPRSLPIQYYKDKLREILALIAYDAGYAVKVYTDIPKESMSFEPRPGDIGTWKKSGHDISEGKIRVDGSNLEQAFQEFGTNIEFVYGGDPLDTLIQMSNADYFVMSRSSYSYLAGILNQKGVVFHPPGFWHSPLSNWVKG